MVERIRMLLEARQLTPTQFADTIGVARPIVSHILSGRNKPSLEVVQRILAAMPDLSMPWLLNGTGPMQAEAAEVSPGLVEKTQPERTLAEKPPVAPPLPAPGKAATASPRTSASAARPGPSVAPVSRGHNALEPKALPANALAAGPGPKRFAPSAPKPGVKLVVEPPIPSPPATAVVAPAPAPVAPAAPQKQPEGIPEPAVSAASANPTAAALFAEGEKPIRRIVIFYKDGSFADYQPE
jgi:transcriptional regulator with XRE-family HTH domain